jgi:hypothetical protein
MNKLVEEIEKAPIIQIACDKFGITRNTFYRWMKEDKEFLKKVKHAVSLGDGLVNDVALSNVLSGIKAKNVKYTMYWLNRKHPDFRKPYIYKTDSDDLIANFRIMMDGITKQQIERDIHNNAKNLDADKMKEAMENMKKFQDKWFKKKNNGKDKKK